jgi:tripartite-type tricarboxylate transporter receptor subunit TctC
MLTTRFVVSIFPTAMMVLGAGMLSAQTYPNKPIRVLASGAGGGTDLVARQIAQAISGPLGQPVIVENRGGVTLSIEIVSRANPDGHTLLVGGSTIWTLPLLQSKVLWDPVKDFSPITFATATPSIVCVHSALPVKSVKELIALAKAKPGALNYSASGIGSASHLGAELFKSMAGVNIVGVSYKSNGPATLAVASGEVQMTIGGTSAVLAVKSGSVRALAVSSLKPSALFPELPTVAASGLPGYESRSVNAVFAPGKTPPPIIRRLNQEIVRFLSVPQVKESFINDGQEVDPTTPEEFAAKIKSEMALMGKMIKDIGLKID